MSGTSTLLAARIHSLKAYFSKFPLNFKPSHYTVVSDLVLLVFSFLENPGQKKGSFQRGQLFAIEILHLVVFFARASDHVVYRRWKHRQLRNTHEDTAVATVSQAGDDNSVTRVTEQPPDPSLQIPLILTKPLVSEPQKKIAPLPQPHWATCDLNLIFWISKSKPALNVISLVLAVRQSVFLVWRPFPNDLTSFLR